MHQFGQVTAGCTLLMEFCNNWENIPNSVLIRRNFIQFTLLFMNTFDLQLNRFSGLDFEFVGFV